MKEIFLFIPIIILFLGISSCASYMEEYNDKDDNVRFYHGQKLQDVFISVENFSAEEIEFKIRRGPQVEYLYHIIVDENDERISEGWYPAYKTKKEHYIVKMKPKEGKTFQSGKTYRLCVTEQNPEFIYYYSKNVQCEVYYEFVFPEK
jgi:hypothetical protein